MKNAELKKGDRVYYIEAGGGSTSKEKFTIVDIHQMEAPDRSKGEAQHATQKALYGKEIQETSRPTLSFVIEPLRGGKRRTVNQGEIELAEME